MVAMRSSLWNQNAVEQRSPNLLPVLLVVSWAALAVAGCYNKEAPTDEVPCYPSRLADQVPDGVIRNGESSLLAWLEQIAEGQESQYGFSSRDEFEQAELGEPYRILTVAEAAVLAGENAPDEIISFTDEWYLPIVATGTMRIVLTLLNEGGGWNFDALSQPDLATELDAFEQAVDRYSTECSTGLLRSTTPTFDVVVVSDPERGPLFYPLDPNAWGSEFAGQGIGAVEFEVAEFAARTKQMLE
jgi:hypothetical protein